MASAMIVNPDPVVMLRLSFEEADALESVLTALPEGNTSPEGRAGAALRSLWEELNELADGFPVDAHEDLRVSVLSTVGTPDGVAVS